MSAFEIWSRWGRVVAAPEPLETKFNPWHDPKDGRFTFANQGQYFSGGGRGGGGGGGWGARPKWRTGGRMSRQEVERRAANAMRVYQVHLARGMTPEQAAGWAANAEAESRSNYRSRQEGGGPGRGLFQWGANKAKYDRRLIFQRLFGHSIEQSTEKEQLDFRDWELVHTQASAAKKISQAKTAGEIAATVTLHYERPDDKFKAAIDRANIAETILRRARGRH